MFEYYAQKGDQTYVWKAETYAELVRSVYAAADGPDATITHLEAVIITDRIDVVYGYEEPGLFSWTEDVVPKPRNNNGNS